MYIGIAGNALVSNTAKCLGNGDVRPRTNSSILRDPGVTCATGRANVARSYTTIFIYYTGSLSTREVAFVTKQEDMLRLFLRTIL